MTAIELVSRLFIISLIAFAAVGIWTLFFHTDDEPFAPISYASPAFVVNDNGNPPRVAGFEPPSVAAPDGLVPIQLTRFIDCAVYSCPTGAIPVTVDVSWTQVLPGGASGLTFTSLEGFETLYEEGSDYEKNLLQPVTNQLQPNTIPDDVLAHIWRSGLTDSQWRIEGITTPERSDGQPAGWVTEVFTVVYPEAEKPRGQRNPSCTLCDEVEEE